MRPSRPLMGWNHLIAILPSLPLLTLACCFLCLLGRASRSLSFAHLGTLVSLLTMSAWDRSCFPSCVFVGTPCLLPFLRLLRRVACLPSHARLGALFASLSVPAWVRCIFPPVWVCYILPFPCSSGHDACAESCARLGVLLAPLPVPVWVRCLHPFPSPHDLANRRSVDVVAESFYYSQ